MHDRPACDLVVLSHLRWNFVFQRPQHVLTRFARHGRVFFVEEPKFGGDVDRLEVRRTKEGVLVVTPHLPEGIDDGRAMTALRDLLGVVMADHRIRDYVLWYYTPMAVPFTRHLAPRAAAVVYDCMDELSHFKGAPPALLLHEAELFTMTDVVFAGGQSLYEHKRARHSDVHAFPSSIDADHFRAAREPTSPDPEDQRDIPHPRLGYFGVIDERMDLALLEAVAQARPGWHLVLLGPLAKIDAAAVPRLPNIHLLGQKGYDELPAYIARWDVALLPFARNEATRFISPTKTPEYLAAGRQVVSTSIRDVVRPYGELGLVRIADTPDAFVAAVEQALAQGADAGWLARVDEHLAASSWDDTAWAMGGLVQRAIEARAAERGRRWAG